MQQDVLDFGASYQVDRFSRLTPTQLVDREKESVVCLALDVIRESIRTGEAMTDSTAVKTFLRLKMASYTREVFAVLFLDNQHRMLAFEELFKGSIASCEVKAREIVQRSMTLNASAVILAHNHPSGVVEPSTSDKRITEQICTVLDLLDVRVLDHIVVGSEGVTSFAETGLL